MILQFIDVDGRAVGRITGALDVYTIEALQARCRTLIKEGQRSIILDLKDVDFVDSAGIGALVKINQWLRRHGRRLAISEPSPVVLNLLRSMRLDGFFFFVESVLNLPIDAKAKDREWKASKRLLLFGTSEARNRQARELLEKEGYSQVFTAEYASRAVTCCENEPVDLVIIDIEVPVTDALELNENLTSAGRNLTVVHTSFEFDPPQDERRERVYDVRRSFLTLVMSALLGEEYGLVDLLRERLKG